MTNTNTITKQMELKAPIEKVWRALTDHQQFGKWFGAQVDGPFVAGQMSTGMVSCCNPPIKWAATIERIDPQHTFAYRWHPFAIDPETDYSKEPTTLVEFKLEAIASGTKLTVTESGFDALPKHRMPKAFHMNTEGWGKQLENVRKYVES